MAYKYAGVKHILHQMGWKKRKETGRLISYGSIGADPGCGSLQSGRLSAIVIGLTETEELVDVYVDVDLDERILPVFWAESATPGPPFNPIAGNRL